MLCPASNGRFVPTTVIAHKQKAARRRPLNSYLMIVDQVAINAGVDFRR
jgi:hypothetical protein